MMDKKVKKIYKYYFKYPHIKLDYKYTPWAHTYMNIFSPGGDGSRLWIASFELKPK